MDDDEDDDKPNKKKKNKGIVEKYSNGSKYEG